jgi:hypothetical protein
MIDSGYLTVGKSHFNCKRDDVYFSLASALALLDFTFIKLRVHNESSTLPIKIIISASSKKSFFIHLYCCTFLRGMHNAFPARRDLAHRGGDNGIAK